MERSEVLDKLAKLLSKTTVNGASEAEAQSAMAMAQRMMDLHGIEANEIEMNGGERADVIEFLAWENEIDFSHYRMAMRVVEKAFSVVAVSRAYTQTKGNRTRKVKAAIFLYGEPANVEAGSHGLVFLATTFRHLWDRHRIAARAKTSEMLGYYLGLGDGFLAKLDEGRAQLELERPGACRTLALRIERPMQAAQAANPNMQITKQEVAADSYAAGVRDGKSISLTRAVERGQRSQLEA